MPGDTALERMLAATRAAALVDRERALGAVLERLLVGCGGSGGLLVAYDRAGREAGRCARGAIDSARAASLVQRGAASDAGAFAAQLSLDTRAIGAAYVEGLGPAAAQRFDAQLARTTVAVANATLLGDAQARGELLARLGHEVRNPLAGILGFSDLLPDEKQELSPRYIHLMAHIQDDAQRLKRCIESLLELVRAEAAPPATGVPVAAACAALERRFNPWATAKGVTLTVTGAPVLALAEPEMLLLGIANLIANALFATAAGGSVAVRATLRPAAAAEPRFGAPAAQVGIEVADTGPGLPPSALEARAGGLYVAREIARLYGGELDSSSSSAGARMTLTLPAVPA